MLAYITNYWFLTLPAVLTAFLLQRALMLLREEETAKAQILAAVAANREGN